MNKIIGFRRSRNGSMLYYVIKDSEGTLQVRRCLSWSSQSEHCKTFPFEKDNEASFKAVLLRARTLTDALSRMSPDEAQRQAENIRQYGEVR